MTILWAEGGNPNANIHSGSDAVWWAYVTVTTVGYGDRYPVTNEGRLIGIALLTIGVGLFGVLTGFLANTFLAPKHDAAAVARGVGAGRETRRVGQTDRRAQTVDREQSDRRGRIAARKRIHAQLGGVDPMRATAMAVGPNGAF